MKKENIFQDTNHLNVTPPEWTNTLREEALSLLKEHTTSGVLKSVQYDINPDEQALEMYQIILKNGTITTAFIAYRNDKTDATTDAITPTKKQSYPKDYVLTIHLTSKNITNEQHSK